MQSLKTNRAVAGALMAAALMGMGGSIGQVQKTNAPLMPWAPKGKTKPKRGVRNPLRGYYGRYSHVLTEGVTSQNLANKANGKTGFKGFRKVRKFIKETGMSVWVPA